LRGLWHVSGPPISKYALLVSLNHSLGTGTTVERDESIRYDRSLDSSRFWATTGLHQPAWETMIQELAAEKALYDRLSRKAPTLDA
jgi:dTDP-4-dehydrorhamnose reductase